MEKGKWEKMAKKRLSNESKPTGGPSRVFTDPGLRAALLERLSKGVSRTAAAESLGVTRQTIRNECERDPEFALAVMSAEASGRVTLESRVFDASLGDWKAAVAMLQSKYFDWSKDAHNAIPVKEFLGLIKTLAGELFAAVPAEYHRTIHERVESFVANVVLKGGGCDD